MTTATSDYLNMPPVSEHWAIDCLKWRGHVLRGKFRHWCHDWDELPVDETTPEFSACCCDVE